MKFADFQASSTFELDGKIMTACEKCRMDYAERTPPGTPPCESCRVELVSENEDAARIFQLVRRQCQTRWNGEQDIEVDLDFNAVKVAMDLYGIKNQRECFEKVRRVFHKILSERRENEG